MICRGDSFFRLTVAQGTRLAKSSACDELLREPINFDMDAEDIKTRIISLGRRQFKAVVSLFLKRYYNLTAIDIDGPGDSGNDWFTFKEPGGKILRLCVQDTVQDQRWEEKAVKDAIKAVSELNANRYFFFTKRAHNPSNVLDVRNRIYQDAEVDAEVWEATSMAQMIVTKEWEEDFLSAIGSAFSQKRPSMPEISLCTYCNLSADAKTHRDEIYADTLLSVLRECDPTSKEKLIESVLHLLGSSPGQRQLIDKQIQSLLSKKKVVQHSETKLLSLSNQTRKMIEQSERLYFNDWAELKTKLGEVLLEFKVHWKPEDAEVFTVNLARWFVANQMEGLRNAGAELLSGSWAQNMSAGDQSLREILHDLGVKPKQFREVVSKLVETARSAPVLSKLVRTAVFAALEGRDPLLSARALGAVGWPEVRILLDASVAIPFLCAALTEPVHDFIYGLSSEALECLRGLGAICCVTTGHLEECASHLLQASYYDDFDEEPEFLGALKNSENAFVAFYFSLRCENKSCPPSLREFLNLFSTYNVNRRDGDWFSVLRGTASDLRDLLRNYTVTVVNEDRVSSTRYDELARRHDLLLGTRPKPFHLRAHDLHALAHLEAKRESNDNVWMLLTWDKLLMRLAQEELKSSWVISPEVAMDFSQPCRRLSDTQWCAIAHKVARTASPGDALASKIIDVVAHLASDRLKDWHFRESIRKYTEEAKSRLPDNLTDAYHGWVESEAHKFLSSKDIEVPATENPLGTTAPPHSV